MPWVNPSAPSELSDYVTKDNTFVGGALTVDNRALQDGVTRISAELVVNAPAYGRLPAEQAVFLRHAIITQVAGVPSISADPFTEDHDNAASAARATGTIVMPAAASLADGDTIAIPDQNSTTTFKIDKTGAVFDPVNDSSISLVKLSGKSKGQLGCSKPNGTEQGKIVTIYGVIFEFRNLVGSVTGGHTWVDTSAWTNDSAQVAASLAAAITGGGIGVTATAVGSVVTLLRTAVGANNTAITTNAAFVSVNYGMAYGAAAAAVTGADVATLLDAAINADATLDVASTPTGASLALLADANGYDRDIAITTSNNAISVDGMKLGSLKMAAAFAVDGSNLVGLALTNLPPAPLTIAVRRVSVVAPTVS